MKQVLTVCDHCGQIDDPEGGAWIRFSYKMVVDGRAVVRTAPEGEAGSMRDLCSDDCAKEFFHKLLVEARGTVTQEEAMTKESYDEKEFIP